MEDQELPLIAAETEDELAEELAEGALDPDEVDPQLEPWDEGADDE
jgi:hypothetical protein